MLEPMPRGLNELVPGGVMGNNKEFDYDPESDHYKADDEPTEDEGYQELRSAAPEVASIEILYPPQAKEKSEAYVHPSTLGLFDDRARRGAPNYLLLCRAYLVSMNRFTWSVSLPISSGLDWITAVRTTSA